MILCKQERLKPTRKWTVVSYYTVNTPYENEAELLKLSLHSVGCSYAICGVENRGSWQRNTQMKAEFIRLMLDAYKTAIVYLDVDAIVVKYPKAFDTLKCDIAAVHFADTRELLSGTVYFAGTPACVKTVDRWIELNAEHPEVLPDGRVAWDQRTLALAIKEVNPAFIELPQSLTWIAELTQKRCPNVDPIIMHTRGAKRFKNQIDGLGGFAE
jgi:hypothetical protein